STIAYTPTTKVETLSYPARIATANHPAVPGFTVGFVYDTEDRLQSMTDPLGTTTNSYNSRNQLTGHTDPHGHQVQYAYDVAGNLSQLTYPDGRTLSYSYDSLNRIDNVSIDWLIRSATPSYDDAGRLENISHFNGTQTGYGYDNADRLTDLNHTRNGSTTLVDYHFVLDANGNRTQATIVNEVILPEQLSNASQSQSYNAQKNRLLSATSNDTKNYSYDNEGQTQTVTGQNTNNSYVFDGAHRLTGYTTASQTNSYQYDGIGNRLSATRNGQTTQYIYDAVGNLLAEANSSGTLTRYYIHGLGLMAFVGAQTSQLYVYHHDATGHTVAITDINQNVVNKYAYDPYGKLMAKQEQVNQPFTYVGQYGVMTEAEDTDLYYMRARYYDAQIGRFISEDPIGMAGGINLYAYVGGNPVMLVDPSGLYAGYGNGLYSNYYATKRAAEAADRDDHAKLSAQIGDALTIATPFSGALAPSIGGMATAFTALSMALSPSKNMKTGLASIIVGEATSFALKKVKGPLELTDAAISAASGLVQTPIAIMNIANGVSDTAASGGTGLPGSGVKSGGKPKGW
ncbi:MAG: RHS repeat-associated core domain-containing protein, partial [Gammaproteobacteria bacterium]|nr:RHS repeat-associated core domain-containing protein [Gammaproteobacteria bacterium]MBQ0841241.1 RHS repeat-associated core domain-containing protein [Gammaproteobacteria bacterium]